MKLLKSIVVLSLVFIFILSSAIAEDSPTFIQYNDTGKPIGWLQDCIGVTETYNGTPWFGDETMSALESFQREEGLDVSCEFDAPTLKTMLGLPMSDLDKLVWIPMHGGVKYHANYWCSGMIEPRQMPVDCAKCFDFTPCKRCY